MSSSHWDIFCRVVDNFGDLGVCWRLARQLALEHGKRVRLWLDGPKLLHLIAPERDDTIEVLPWENVAETTKAADVVIEAFACELPPLYLQAMADRKNPPCWLNLEYLSAEEWIEGCHGLASPHPRLKLAKYFFFPGFTPKSGGLLRERDLLLRQRDRADLLARLGIKDQPDALLLTLFCYRSAPIAALIEAWKQAPCLRPALCLVPPGQPYDALSAHLGEPSAKGWQVGQVHLVPIPFLSQEAYDSLLFVSDFNFVRGEDSFIRAQWAGKPFVWQAYQQAENAHHAKIDAFAERYRPHPLLLDFWRFWNDAEHDENTPGNFWQWLCADRAALDELDLCAQNWRAYLLAQEDLASRLVGFCGERQLGRYRRGSAAGELANDSAHVSSTSHSCR